MTTYTKVDETKFSEVVPEKVVTTELKDLVEQKRMLDLSINTLQAQKDMATARITAEKAERTLLVEKIAAIRLLGVKTPEEIVVVAQPSEVVI